jgi:hypothetical protein
MCEVPGTTESCFVTMERCGLLEYPGSRHIRALSALTRMHRWAPGGRQVRTSLVMKWAAEGLLCLLTLEGRAATVAQFR